MQYPATKPQLNELIREVMAQERLPWTIKHRKLICFSSLSMRHPYFKESENSKSWLKEEWSAGIGTDLDYFDTVPLIIPVPQWYFCNNSVEIFSDSCCSKVMCFIPQSLISDKCTFRCLVNLFRLSIIILIATWLNFIQLACNFFGIITMRARKFWNAWRWPQMHRLLASSSVFRHGRSSAARVGCSFSHLLLNII